MESLNVFNDVLHEMNSAQYIGFLIICAGGGVLMAYGSYVIFAILAWIQIGIGRILFFFFPELEERFNNRFTRGCDISADIVYKVQCSNNKLVPEIEECDPEVEEFDRIRNSKLF